MIAGLTSRVVATSGSRVGSTAYTWHGAPDGGACFPAANSGWTYVFNSEKGSGAGGAGSITFNSSGTIVGARRILSGTNRNCAGGATPWGTWLSCEENGAAGKGVRVLARESAARGGPLRDGQLQPRGRCL